MKSVKFLQSLIKQVKRIKFKVATKTLQNKLNIAERSYGLSKIQTFFKHVERL